ncbi:Uncharacterised protein [Legionella busanensis]|uniref:Homeodomain phBC6A51-type domain-containing protein n=1 Tax=Legionella busanensis TaxID=190655 RepID=A0A378JJY5_9GAMM|nr:transposase [Legionella busanensis]STX50470.1 Uncharacterised protein [Legionella busanensis]
MVKRPKYSRELCKQLLPLFKDGRSVIEVCQALGITRKTYNEWKMEHKEFNDAAEIAEEAAFAKIISLGRMALLSNGKIKIDTALYCFILKTQFNYSELIANSVLGSEKAQPLTINFSVKPAVSEVTVTNAKAIDEENLF